MKKYADLQSRCNAEGVITSFMLLSDCTHRFQHLFMHENYKY